MNLNLDTSEFDTSGNRTSATCHWKCGDACATPVLNQTENLYSRNVIEEAIDRRSILKGGFASLMMLSGVSSYMPAAAQGGNLGFSPIKLSTEDKTILPSGYESNVIIRWGDPVTRGAKRFNIDDFDVKTQENSFGYNCDYVSFLPLPGFQSKRSTQALLFVNHEYTNPDLMFRGYTAGKATKQQVDVELAAHGATVVQVFRDRDGNIEYQPVSRYNRRITANTPMEMTGPAAGHPLLQTRADPTGKLVLGTLNNCAGGTTPWGTVLTGEENFNQYFAYNDNVKDANIKALHARYGMPAKASGRVWENYYERF